MTYNKRNELCKDFLSRHQWNKYDTFDIPGDASTRRYKRISRKAQISILTDSPRPVGVAPFISETNEQVILMDSPDDKVTPFVIIAHHLTKIGLHAPQIYARDDSNGFLLLEDFGTISLTSLLANNTSIEVEKKAYQTAIDALVKLQNSPLSTMTDLPHYSLDLLMKEVHLLLEYFLPYLDIKNLTSEQKKDFDNIWTELLPNVVPTKEQGIIVLRDYHADNLMMIDGQFNHIDNLGLLDFQDAVIGHPAYDLVSLIEDARRNALDTNNTWEIANELIDYYINNSFNLNKEQFLMEYAILGAQRNCKILGIFARLFVRDNKPHYLNYLPRVWHCLMHDLDHPSLHPLQTWIDSVIPENKRSLLIATG